MRDSALGARPGTVLRGLMHLYPRAWRARYGEEFAALLADQPLSLTLVVDVAAGAVDAWLHPGLVAQPAKPVGDSKGEKTMIGRMLKLRCAGYGPEVTTEDQWKAVGVMLGLTVVLTVVWMWLHARIGDNAYIDAFAPMSFLVAYLLSMPYTTLKGRTKRSQAVFIGINLLILTGIAVVSGFIASRI